MAELTEQIGKLLQSYTLNPFFLLSLTKAYTLDARIVLYPA